MENKKVKFKAFLKANNIKKKELPGPIQELIKIHNQMYGLIDTMEEQNLQELLDQLEQLDIEILEDIEEVYEDQLTNNTMSETETKTENQPKKQVTKVVVLTQDQVDEKILEELVKMKRMHSISRSKLQEMGIKTAIDGDTQIGNYVLKRTSFLYYRYDIVKIN